MGTWRSGEAGGRGGGEAGRRGQNRRGCRSGSLAMGAARRRATWLAGGPPRGALWAAMWIAAQLAGHSLGAVSCHLGRLGAATRLAGWGGAGISRRGRGHPSRGCNSAPELAAGDQVRRRGRGCQMLLLLSQCRQEWRSWSVPGDGEGRAEGTYHPRTFLGDNATRIRA
jgi:hypothetical protein